jgi:hypothetical protein
MNPLPSESNSAGRVPPSQGGCRGFEPRLPLHSLVFCQQGRTGRQSQIWASLPGSATASTASGVAGGPGGLANKTLVARSLITCRTGRCSRSSTSVQGNCFVNSRSSVQIRVSAPLFPARTERPFGGWRAFRGRLTPDLTPEGDDQLSVPRAHRLTAEEATDRHRDADGCRWTPWQCCSERSHSAHWRFLSE